MTFLRRAVSTEPLRPLFPASYCVFVYECRRRFTPHESQKKVTLCRPYVRHALIVAYVMMVIRLVMMAVSDEGKCSKTKKLATESAEPLPLPKRNPKSSCKKSKL